ncbi:putative vacuolar protein sorting-associated protein [Helianthus annuus]|uniref:Vacuolar protein sorting-associated protein n=1 Tax=Helianthus annuus TaxID=4232 RepID=A0A251SRU8_HELAN|nr:uncharacterized protein LOC110898579 [Helianthus annuus]KAF5822509.1 putative vacuolar protein sorting-associated protein [Helianthus annuus]KAJ0611969.1 putative vacuolar protein sorting-associated protein [Helianthus annuus]KAJ0627338.1 putative vacuolar protein sorting-associated protein [Helianthus annuus]
MGLFFSLLANLFKKCDDKPLPIESIFKLPSPIPKFPPGDGFATGVIDLGGLQVCQISTFNKIWSALEGGPDNKGATFYEPSSIPDGFFMLGCYSQPNNRPLFGWILAAKTVTNNSFSSHSSLAKPTDYSLIWSSESKKIKQDGGNCYIWLPTPPEGYKPVGYLVTNSPEKPSVEKIRCVQSEFADAIEVDGWIWGLDKKINTNNINMYEIRPKDRGVNALSVSTGSFVVQNVGATADVSLVYCLKNTKNNLMAMPNLSQVEALIQAYSPVIYFHPDEAYFPSSVDWFFQNGALLYEKGKESEPRPIQPDGSNLPQGGSNDDLYWLDLPKDDSSKERVKKGDLAHSCAYFHIKPMFGATFTDIPLWIFYPFNGPARAKVGIFNVSLGKIGEHVGDWEHLTLRVSNYNGELKSVYFSEHSGGQMIDASDIEFENGNKPVAYSSLHGHAFYSKPGLVLQGSGSIGIRNDASKGKMMMDTGITPMVVAAEYLGQVVVEPMWLNYSRKWGPKISYDITNEIKKVRNVLPKLLRGPFDKFVRGLPNELLGEEGPTGPKMKNNWSGDEKY